MEWLFLFNLITTFGNLVGLYYLWINQFSFYILSQHMTIYRKSLNNLQFDKWRKKIFRKEWQSFLIFILWSFIVIIAIATITIAQLFSDTNISRITHGSTIIIVSALCFNEYVIYKKTMGILRRTLSFYYNKRLKSMKRTLIINLWFLTTMFTFEVFRLIFPVAFKYLPYFNT